MSLIDYFYIYIDYFYIYLIQLIYILNELLTDRLDWSILFKKSGRLIDITALTAGSREITSYLLSIGVTVGYISHPRGTHKRA